MIELENTELLKINGGGLSGTLINAITGAGRFIFNIGQSIGSSIRRMVSGPYSGTDTIIIITLCKLFFIYL